VSKVQHVQLMRRGERYEGTLHVMPHHLVFTCLPTPPPADAPNTPPPRPREVWITYPLINYCCLKPSPPALRQHASMRIRCRDFTFFAFFFADDGQARAVYDSIRALACRLGRLDRLLAFSYQPKPPEDTHNGWLLYDARREWRRLGISPKHADTGWRISEINAAYQYAETYPALVVVPANVSDSVLRYAGEYRSRHRIPALVYRHPLNNCSITRSSQPTPGLRGNRNAQDERLVAAIWATNRGPTAPSTHDLTPESSCSDADVLPKVYGAQQRNLIVDARPTVNAYAMQAIGLGSENMDHYPGAEKAYLGIDNIHVMRKSLDAVIEAIKESDLASFPPNRQLLAKSNWIKHIANILDGTALIATTVGIMHSHVLIHCSDGWDRTSQLSALSQILLDPYYRTLEGFMILVEKDWLSFGHMFRHRSGFLSHEKWFTIENEKLERGNDGSAGGNPFENAIRGARVLFNRHNDSNDSLNQLPDTTGTEAISELADVASPTPVKAGAAEEMRVTKPGELSPVFHQFLDCVYQIHHQHPTRFEFSERFLRRLLYHLYSCQYGTFLFDSEKERVDAKAKQRTRSVWDYFLCRRQEFMNPKYDPEVNDDVRGKERMIFPRKGQARWWAECFGRTDEEMNVFGPQAPANLAPQTGHASATWSGTSTPLPEEPVVTATDTAEGATGTQAGTQADAELPSTLAIGVSAPHSATETRFLNAAPALRRYPHEELFPGVEKLHLDGVDGYGVGGAAMQQSPPCAGEAEPAPDSSLSTELQILEATERPKEDRSRGRNKEMRKETEVEMQ